MKKLIIALAAVAMAATSYGQGQFVFVNRAVGFFDVPVYIQDTTTGAGSLGDVRAQLWTADGGTMLAESTFRSSDPGSVQSAYFFNQDVTVDGNTGTPLDVELRFLLDGNLINGAGDFTFTVTPAVAPNPPSRIGGFEAGLNGGVDGPLYVVPEPSTIALAVLGVGAFLLRRRKK